MSAQKKNAAGKIQLKWVRSAIAAPEKHKKVVRGVLQQLFEKGEIYRAEYDGWYCIPDERFFTETPDTYTFAKKDAQPIPQTWIVGDADHVVAEIEAFRAEYGVTDIGMAGLPPGIDPEFMAANLERIATEVLPRLR